jgi:hypothetical protein
MDKLTIDIPYDGIISNFDVAKAIMNLCPYNEYLDPTAIATMLLTEEEARTQRELRCVGACIPKEKAK